LSLVDEFLALSRRAEKLRDSLTRVHMERERIEQERGNLKKELQEARVDTENLEAESTRLTTEIEAGLTMAQNQIAAAEKYVKQTGMVSTGTTPDDVDIR